MQTHCTHGEAWRGCAARAPHASRRTRTARAPLPVRSAGVPRHPDDAPCAGPARGGGGEGPRRAAAVVCAAGRRDAQRQGAAPGARQVRRHLARPLRRAAGGGLPRAAGAAAALPRLPRARPAARGRLGGRARGAAHGGRAVQPRRRRLAPAPQLPRDARRVLLGRDAAHLLLRGAGRGRGAVHPRARRGGAAHGAAGERVLSGGRPDVRVHVHVHVRVQSAALRTCGTAYALRTCTARCSTRWCCRCAPS